jgi:hypothetical protein
MMVGVCCLSEPRGYGGTGVPAGVEHCLRLTWAWRCRWQHACTHASIVHDEGLEFHTAMYYDIMQ